MTDGSLAPQDLAHLLLKWRSGDKRALDEMTPVVYEELSRLARHFLAAERPDHTLQPTALVHEAYLRLIGQHAVDWRNRAHFMAMAATMMRRILINHAQAHKAAKREGSVQMVALDEALGVPLDSRLDILHLNTTLERLTSLDEQQGRVVELRYFGGLSVEETAEVLGISPATVKREWSTARLWLMQQMEGGPVQ